MRLILDTNVLWDPKALRRLEAVPVPLVLPAVAYAERVRQFALRGWPPDDLDEALEGAGIRVEPLSQALARRIAGRPPPDDVWTRHGRDVLIALHVEAEDLLVTHDGADFCAVGLRPGQVVSPQQVPEV